MVTLRILFSLLFCIIQYNFLSAQVEQSKNSTVINYNYQNKLRFEWPVTYSYFSQKTYYDRILKTPEFTDVILSYLEEIRYEANTNQPLDIVLVQMNQTVQMHIYRNIRPVTYHTKDTSLLFHGLHRFRIVSAGEQDMFIYFDEVGDLLLLKKINFVDIHYNLKSQKYVSRYQLVRSTDLFFSDISGDLVYTGKLGFKTKKVFTPNVLVGASVGPDRLGVSLGTEIGVANYAVYPYGQTFVRSKYGFHVSVYWFDQFRSTKMGLFYMQKPVISSKKNMPMVGFGAGIVGGTEGPLYNPELNTDRLGFYFSLMYEWENIRLNLDFNQAIDKKSSSDVWVPVQLSLYYVF